MVYYILEIYDIIKENDEYFNPQLHTWVKVDQDLIGKKVEHAYNPFRREIKIASPTNPCFNCGYDGEDYIYERTCPACLEEGI